AKEWKTLCATFDNKCLACGKPEVTLDHIIPLAKGGSHTIDNAQPLCLSCNSSKQHRIIVNYRPDHQNLPRLWFYFRYTNPVFREVLQTRFTDPVTAAVHGAAYPPTSQKHPPYSPPPPRPSKTSDSPP